MIRMWVQCMDFDGLPFKWNKSEVKAKSKSIKLCQLNKVLNNSTKNPYRRKKSDQFAWIKIISLRFPESTEKHNYYLKFKKCKIQFSSILNRFFNLIREPKTKKNHWIVFFFIVDCLLLPQLWKWNIEIIVVWSTHTTISKSFFSPQHHFLCPSPNHTARLSKYNFSFFSSFAWLTNWL